MDQKTTPGAISVPSIQATKPFLGNRILLLLSIGIVLSLISVGLLYSTLAPQQKQLPKSPTPKSHTSNPPQQYIQAGKQTIFVIGGYYRDKTTKTTPATNSAEFYDGNSSSWHFTPPMHDSHAAAAATVYNNKIYVFGGQSGNVQEGTTTVEMFDPTTNNWTNMSPMPHPRLLEQALTLGDKIYILGGWDATGANDTSMNIYNPLTNTWQNGTPLPTTNDYVTSRCGVVQSKIYCPGLGEHSYTVTYDPTTNQWQSLPTENRQETVNSNWASNDQFMYGVYFEKSNNIQQFNQATDTLTTLPGGKYIDKTYQGFSPLSFGSNLLLIGGKFSADPVRDVYFFNTANSTSWQKITPLNIGRLEAAVVLLPLSYTGIPVNPSPTPLSNVSSNK